MNCWACNGAGVTTAALATCPVCGVGLCRHFNTESDSTTEAQR